jgi:hypothetical protein
LGKKPDIQSRINSTNLNFGSTRFPFLNDEMAEQNTTQDLTLFEVNAQLQDSQGDLTKPGKVAGMLENEQEPGTRANALQYTVEIG